MRKLFSSPLSWFANKTEKVEPTVVSTDLASDSAVEPVVALVVYTAAPEPIVEVIEVREPGPVVQLMKRGPRTYSICPHCEASWSLRDRLYDPRTGRPCALDTLVCPTCLKSVSVPVDLDLRKVQ